MPLLRNVFVLNSSYVRLSPESAQVKLSATEIEFQFTILWENYGQNFIMICQTYLERKNLWRSIIQVTTEVESLNFNH